MFSTHGRFFGFPNPAKLSSGMLADDVEISSQPDPLRLPQQILNSNNGSESHVENDLVPVSNLLQSLSTRKSFRIPGVWRAGAFDLKSSSGKSPSSKAHAENPSAIFSESNTQPWFKDTQKLIAELIDLVLSGQYVEERSVIKTAVLKDLPAGFRLSSHTEKAVDSLIDIFITARQFGIVGANADQIHPRRLREILTVLYLHESHFVRIDEAELTHVPIVVQGTLDFLDHLSGGRATRAQKKSAFLQALLHDSGKFDLNLRSESGFELLPHPIFNRSGQTIGVKPGQTLAEALREQNIDVALVAIPPILVSTILHNDSVAVRQSILELVAAGDVSSREAKVMWQSVQAHGMVSSWILDNSLGGIGVKSNLYIHPRYRHFLHLYRACYGKVAKSVASTDWNAEWARLLTDRDLTQQLSALRAEFQDCFPITVQALMLGDHQGQNDVPKYLKIFFNKLKSQKDLTVHEMIFGQNAKGKNLPTKMSDSIVGVLLTHSFEQQLLNPDAAENARPAFQRTLDCLFADQGRGGFVDAVLSVPEAKSAFEEWQSQVDAEDATFGDWIKTLKVYNANGQADELYKKILIALEKRFYELYAPVPELILPSKFAFSSF